MIGFNEVEIVYIVMDVIRRRFLYIRMLLV